VSACSLTSTLLVWRGHSCPRRSPVVKDKGSFVNRQVAGSIPAVAARSCSSVAEHPNHYRRDSFPDELKIEFGRVVKTTVTSP